MAAGDGLVTMTPTSVDVTGTSASINADGGVDFTAVTSLSLNGVFTSSFDNYLIVTTPYLTGSADEWTLMRLRSSGSDATATNYTVQYLIGNNTSLLVNRLTSQSSGPLSVSAESVYAGTHTHVYGPFLAQPTVWRLTGVSGRSGAYIHDIASTHSLSTSYDGFTCFPAAGSITGNIVVFGYEE